MAESSVDIAALLNQRLLDFGLEPLDSRTAVQFGEYCALLLRWNARTNLTAIRDLDGILTRHFVECIACARALPPEVATLLDFGSGAGFPGIPIALCCPRISVTLSESQGKKAAFLQEAARALGMGIKVHSGRAESVLTRFDWVTLRAVDRMPQAIRSAVPLLEPAGRLAVLTSVQNLPSLAEFTGTLNWQDPIHLPGSEHRILVLGELATA